MFSNKTIILFAVMMMAVFSGSAYMQKPLVKASLAGVQHDYDSRHIAKHSAFIKASLQGLPEGGILSDAPAIKSFYEINGNNPVWVGQPASQNRVDSIIRVFEDAWTHGLNPEQYHLREIKSIWASSNAEEHARLELLISDAVIRYAQDMTAMRVDPASIDQKAKYWNEPLAGGHILQTINNEIHPGSVLEKLAPKNKLYTMLRDELIKEVGGASEYDAILPINLGEGVFHPGAYNDNVSKIRLRLGVEYNSDYGSKNRYDDVLAKAIMSFQRTHELAADGIIGPNTLSLLNVTREDRIYQIIANMERLRWQEQQKPERYILVNVPSATLWAVDDNDVKLEMPVVVGKSYRPTRSFKTNVTGVRFNPTWTVPQSIKMKDFLPKLRNDPDYLSGKGFTLIRGYGDNEREVNAEQINWSAMTERKMSGIRMVQSPGNHNALGRVRVLMPNPYSIYLHDTNHKELFSRTGRNLSSGCIRLSRPEDVARFILGKNNNWSDQQMKKVLRTKKTADIRSSKAMPVYILYQTVWLDNHGRLVFGRDVYNLDRELVEELLNLDEIYIPEVSYQHASYKSDISAIDFIN